MYGHISDNATPTLCTPTCGPIGNTTGCSTQRDQRIFLGLATVSVSTRNHSPRSGDQQSVHNPRAFGVPVRCFNLVGMDVVSSLLADLLLAGEPNAYSSTPKLTPGLPNVRNQPRSFSQQLLLMERLKAHFLDMICNHGKCSPASSRQLMLVDPQQAPSCVK